MEAVINVDDVVPRIPVADSLTGLAVAERFLLGDLDGMDVLLASLPPDRLARVKERCETWLQLADAEGWSDDEALIEADRMGAFLTRQAIQNNN